MKKRDVNWMIFLKKAQPCQGAPLIPSKCDAFAQLLPWAANEPAISSQLISPACRENGWVESIKDNLTNALPLDNVHYMYKKAFRPAAAKYGAMRRNGRVESRVGIHGGKDVPKRKGATRGAHSGGQGQGAQRRYTSPTFISHCISRVSQCRTSMRNDSML